MRETVWMIMQKVFSFYGVHSTFYGVHSTVMTIHSTRNNELYQRKLRKISNAQ